MDWIDRYHEEQEEEKRRRESTVEKERVHAHEMAMAFHVVVERLVPQIRSTIQTIKDRLGISLQLEIGKTYLVIEHGEKKAFKKHYFVKIEKRGTGSDLFIVATDDSKDYIRMPPDYQGTMADWRGAEPPKLQLRTSIEELEVKQLDALMEWLTASALGKHPQLPFLADALAQRGEQARKTSTGCMIFLFVFTVAGVILLISESSNSHRSTRFPRNLEEQAPDRQQSKKVVEGSATQSAPSEEPNPSGTKQSGVSDSNGGSSRG